MGIKELISMDESDLVELQRFVKDRTLNVVLHPAWHIFFKTSFKEATKEDNLVQLHTDGSIDLIINSIRDLEKYDDTSFLLYGPGMESSGFYQDDIQLRKARKTNIYLNLILEFLHAYEFLRESAYIEHLRDAQTTCILVLPKGHKRNSQKLYFQHFRDYLSQVTGNQSNFVSLESEGIGCGYIHKPYEKKDGGELTRADLTHIEKLDYLDKLFERIGTESVSLSGGYIHACLSNFEKSLSFCERTPKINVFVDVSVSPELGLAGRALLEYMDKGIVDGMGTANYDKFCKMINGLLSSPSDLTPLAEAKGKNLYQQLAIFEGFPTIVRTIYELKKLYSFKHSNLNYSGFNSQPAN